MKVTKNGITLEIIDDQLSNFESLGYKKVDKSSNKKGESEKIEDPAGDKE